MRLELHFRRQKAIQSKYLEIQAFSVYHRINLQGLPFYHT